MSKKKHDAPEQTGVTRRELIGTTAKIATVGGVVAAGVAGVTPADPPRKAHAATEAGSAHVGPGQLDEYYGFWSSGQAGEVRVFGVPSMRELLRIPVFNRCSATGWGLTNESRKIMTEGLTPETRKFLESRGASTPMATRTTRICRSPTARTTGAISGSTTRRIRACPNSLRRDEGRQDRGDSQRQ